MPEPSDKNVVNNRLTVERLGAFSAVIGLALLGLFWGGNWGAAIGAMIGVIAAARATHR